MNPTDALDAFRDLGARTMIAMHWGTFKLDRRAARRPPRLFRDEAAARGLSEDVVRVAAIGETLTLPAEAEPRR